MRRRFFYCLVVILFGAIMSAGCGGRIPLPGQQTGVLDNIDSPTTQTTATTNLPVTETTTAPGIGEDETSATGSDPTEEVNEGTADIPAEDPATEEPAEKTEMVDPVVEEPTETTVVPTTEATEEVVEPVAFPGSALVFDGTDDHISFSALWDTAPEYITIEAWVYVSQPGGTIVYHGPDHQDNAAFDLAVNAVHFYTGSSSGVEAIRFDAPIIGQWYHMAAVWGHGDLKLYFNGSLVATGRTGPGFMASDFGPAIGSMNRRTGFFNGMLDEVRVWSVARTVEEINGMMYGVPDGDEPGLVAYWSFDEGSGLSVNDLAGGHDGQMVGMTEESRIPSTVPTK